MRVDVLDDHIRTGRRRSCKSCPVAKAIRANLKKGYCLKVFSGHLEIYSDEIYICIFKLSSRARKFILNFDDKKEVKPFSFNLKLPKSLVAQKKA